MPHISRLKVRAMSIVVAGGLVLALSAGCGGLNSKGSSGNNGDFVIGLATATSGDFAQIGKDSQRGAQMAIDEINKSGGFAGHTGKLVVEDTAGKPATGVNAVASLLQRSNAQLLLGPDLSTVTLAAFSVSKGSQVPQISSSISPALTGEGAGNFFRARPSDATNVEIMVKYAVEKLKLKRVAVLYGLDAYGQGSLPAIKSATQKYHLSVTATEGVSPGVKDVTAQVTAAKNANADGILWWGLIPESAVLEKSVNELGFNGVLFGANALVNESTIKLAGPASNGVIAATTFVATNPAANAQEFVKKYQAKYGEQPNDHAPLYYDMVMAANAAVEKAGSTDSSKLTTALHQVEYKGITGDFKWNSQGEFDTLSALIVKIENQQPNVIGQSR